MCFTYKQNQPDRQIDPLYRHTHAVRPLYVNDLTHRAER